VTAATLVDHIIPHREDEGLFWLEGNWQSLCNRCHARKGILEPGLRACEHPAQPSEIRGAMVCVLCGYALEREVLIQHRDPTLEYPS
jgi:hypothetical protein